ncbi:aquaporin AQPAe.a-like [Mya arenaria]|uniref:aquaporin AQPAe.a-like n=1 Tax=Mya arenaria TaxID=6604 RepID=UPI0022DECAEF|nr:aquaporin AQPAe.a-like [Mya arenaria]XP_052818890.1 aquaporin AQPAe.a-like [Mya arenaria]
MNKIMQENIEDLCKPALWRAVVAEFFGTLFLVLFGCGAIDNNGINNSIVQIALAFGLIYGSMVWCFNHVSGGHFNPAVSVAAVVCRRASVVRGLLYIIAQLVGGIAGAGILRGLSADASYTVGVTAVRGTLTEAQGFGVELLISFVLVFVVLASTDDKRCDLSGSAPLTIGLAIVAGTLFAYNYTMASMNPARTFGPALVQNNWANHWVYWVGPIIGGLVAALVYEYVFAAGASFSRTRKFVLKHRKPADKPKKQKNTDELNSSKAGLIEVPTTDNEGDAVLEMEKIEEEKKDEEPATAESEVKAE